MGFNTDIEKAFDIFKTKILKDVDNTNTYTPTNGVKDEDRRKFFTTYNKDLADRIVTIKSIK